jgi:hypothetical protein
LATQEVGADTAGAEVVEVVDQISRAAVHVDNWDISAMAAICVDILGENVWRRVLAGETL